MNVNSARRLLMHGARSATAAHRGALAFRGVCTGKPLLANKAQPSPEAIKAAQATKTEAAIKKAVGKPAVNAARGKYETSTLDGRTYDLAADETMEELVRFLEEVGDDLPIDEFDVEYTQGVLTLNLGQTGTYVINKQPPNKQIWLSSPISGPERFDYDRKQHTWFCRQTGHSLGELLTQEVLPVLNKGRETVVVALPVN